MPWKAGGRARREKSWRMKAEDPPARLGGMPGKGARNPGNGARARLL